MAKQQIDLTKYIGAFPDWPKEGILFRDITPLLADSKAFPTAVDALCAPFWGIGVQYVAAVEARGFIFGSAVAERLGAGFIPVRKKGKLPGATESATYELEYGVGTLEIRRDAVPQGAKVLMVDDLLATGGTAGAAIKLLRGLGAEVMVAAFVIELAFLQGRARLGGVACDALITYA